MKKNLVFGLLIVSLALTIPLTTSQAVSVGDTFRFNVKKAYGSFKYTNGGVTVSGNTSKFRVGNTGVVKGSDLDVEVTALGSSSVDFKISNNGTQLATATSSWLGFGLGLIVYSLYPFIAMGISSGTATAVDPTKGVSLGDIWYVAPPSTNWNSLADYYNDTANWQSFYDSWDDNEDELNVTSYSKYYDDGETLSLIVSASGRYVVSADGTDLGISHSLRFDYNVTSYVLQGYNVFTLILGDYNGEDTTFSMNAQVAEENYTRSLGAPFLWLAVGGLSIFTLAVIIRKRRK